MFLSFQISIDIPLKARKKEKRDQNLKKKKQGKKARQVLCHMVHKLENYYQTVSKLFLPPKFPK